VVFPNQNYNHPHPGCHGCHYHNPREDGFKGAAQATLAKFKKPIQQARATLQDALDYDQAGLMISNLLSLKMGFIH